MLAVQLTLRRGEFVLDMDFSAPTPDAALTSVKTPPPSLRYSRVAGMPTAPVVVTPVTSKSRSPSPSTSAQFTVPA